MPCNVLGNTHIQAAQVTLIVAFLVRYHGYLHCTDEETESQEIKPRSLASLTISVSVQLEAHGQFACIVYVLKL